MRILKEHIPEIKKIWKAKFGSTYDEGLRFLLDSDKVGSKNLATLQIEIESGFTDTISNFYVSKFF